MSGRLFRCNLKIDTHHSDDARHADFFQLEREAFSASPRLHQFHAGIGRLGCIFYMRLLVLPRAKGRISVVARAHRDTSWHTLSPAFCFVLPSPYFKFSFFLTVSMQLCGKSIADSSRYRCAMLILERISERRARALQRTYVHTFFLLLFFFLLKPLMAASISTCTARLFNLYLVSEKLKAQNRFLFCKCQLHHVKGTYNRCCKLGRFGISRFLP